MEVNVQFNPIHMRRIARQLQTTKGAVGLTVQWLCWDQMRLACLDAIKYSPPWAGTPGTGNKQRDQGRSAVKNDIERVFATVENPDFVVFENKGNGKKYGKNKRTGQVFEIPPEFWMPKDLSSRHRFLRNRRGRVPKQRRQSWVQANALAKYTNAVQSRVGSLKASFVPALQYYGGRVGGKRIVPAWIMRQTRKEGTYSDSMRSSGDGRLVSSSIAHHASAIRPSLKKWLEGNRQRQMQKYGERRMQQIADQFNANRTTVQPVRQNAA